MSSYEQQSNKMPLHKALTFLSLKDSTDFLNVLAFGKLCWIPSTACTMTSVLSVQWSSTTANSKQPCVMMLALYHPPNSHGLRQDLSLLAAKSSSHVLIPKTSARNRKATEDKPISVGKSPNSSPHIRVVLDKPYRNKSWHTPNKFLVAFFFLIIV